MSQSAEYVNEIISALETQRNQALKQAAEATANANLMSKQLTTLLRVIKERKLEKFFADEPPKQEAKKPEQKKQEAKKPEPKKEAAKKPDLKKQLLASVAAGNDVQ